MRRRQPVLPRRRSVLGSSDNCRALRVETEIAEAEGEREAAQVRTIHQTIRVVTPSGGLGTANGRIGQLPFWFGLSLAAASVWHIHSRHILARRHRPVGPGNVRVGRSGAHNRVNVSLVSPLYMRALRCWQALFRILFRTALFGARNGVTLALSHGGPALWGKHRRLNTPLHITLTTVTFYPAK